MKRPTDSFGRSFRDMPGDEWSVDQGLPLTIQPDGTVVPPSSGAYADENHGGLFTPTGPHFGPVPGVGNEAIALPINLALLVRFVPKRNYTINALAIPFLTPPPAAPHNAEFGIYECTAPGVLTKRAGIARLNKFPNGGVGGTDLAIWQLATPVTLTAGLVYYTGVWTDKQIVIMALNHVTVMHNKYFSPATTLAGGGNGDVPDLECPQPNALLGGLPNQIGPAQPWVLKTLGFIMILREATGSYVA